MVTVHQMSCSATAQTLLFECADGCGRCMSVDRVTGRMVVIHPGDVVAVHRGAAPVIDLRASSATGSRR